jgi:hypothetical protein
MVHFGTYETHQGEPERPTFRMICYTADHQGPLTPSREIAEKAWFRYAQRDRVSLADQLVFDALHAAGDSNSGPGLGMGGEEGGVAVDRDDAEQVAAGSDSMSRW